MTSISFGPDGTGAVGPVKVNAWFDANEAFQRELNSVFGKAVLSRNLNETFVIAFQRLPLRFLGQNFLSSVGIQKHCGMRSYVYMDFGKL